VTPPSQSSKPLLVAQVGTPLHGPGPLEPLLLPPEVVPPLLELLLVPEP
jgi:hypothetical protein